ncbi:bifunctional riboflavin kinase/FAD synthetase [Oribacterium sp. WCC10]|uniref:bifunctional riboflavin kinase/FAD synthetase n=1 Tax=Oribacterium sp. WCC10 TaxID=1855343 RepID=UPI0008F18736|nr:bifunctional riboflavin kinase/FAD synthetase [Oribacterium sp. WCC10]SFG51947.1 riboflavin kinase/FMN adenylyltransferase/tRNA pseudouridine(55) synthase,TIGR00431 [Oribacterium sp. WCC10]
MDGIIVVRKEKEWTSFDVTKKLRSILHEKKIGHTGTLDPMAEGVLVVCAGTATKLVDAIAGTEKVYVAGMKLGITTDTEDTTGTVLSDKEVNVSEEDIREAVKSFIGSYDQIPPMYSAKKINGQKLYDLARQGKTVERKPNRITIHDIKILSIDIPYVQMEVTCSKGTYIRTLCKDIGEKLGTGAAMSSLIRTRVGQYDIGESHTISEIASMEEKGELISIMKPPIFVPEPAVVSFGKFDGSHLGHQLIFDNMFRIAKTKHLKTAILTFSQNPESLFTGIKKNSISSSDEHLTRLRNLGFDYVFSYPVNKDTMKVPAEHFLRDILVEGMHAKDIVVGTDCSFGHKAQGNAALLTELQNKYGYEAHVIKKRQILDEDGNAREISSTYIREEIQKGNVKLAADLLGRHVALSGTVIYGKQIGTRVLGFPTANMLPKDGKLVPSPGVYVTRVLVGQNLYKGMTNVGTNPTVADDNPMDIETHIIGFKGDLYGKKIRVEFIDRLRDQQKFPSLEDLKKQLQKDVWSAANYPMDL